jgi:drug/metabolite transporter (DMT)-like permease
VIATLLWAVETILAKKLLAGVTARTAALGRMGLGAMVMWLFLNLTGRAGTTLALTTTQWVWVAITSAFLLAYVWTWYSALKAAPASLVTSVLTLGAVITVVVTIVVEDQATSAPQLVAMALMVLGAAAFAFRLPRPSLLAAEAG